MLNKIKGLVKKDNKNTADKAPSDTAAKGKPAADGKPVAGKAAKKQAVMAKISAAKTAWTARLKKISITLLIAALLIAATAYAVMYFRILTPTEMLNLTKLQNNPQAAMVAEKLEEHFKALAEKKAQEEARAKEEKEQAEMKAAQEEAKKEAEKLDAEKKAQENAPAAPKQDTGIDVTEKNQKNIEALQKKEDDRLAEERKRISKLARLYETMPPKDAANIIGKLDDITAIQILLKMEEEAASKILANTNALKAATLSRVMIKYREEKKDIKTLLAEQQLQQEAANRAAENRLATGNTPSQQ